METKLEPGWLMRQIERAIESRKTMPEWLRRIEKQNAEINRRIGK